MISVNLLYMSLTGGVLIVLIVLLRAIAIDKLPKTAFLLLWAVAMLRLLVPVSFPILPVLAETSVSTSEMKFSFLQRVFERTDAFDIKAFSTIHSVSVWFMIWMIGAILMFMFFNIAYYRSRCILKTALPVKSDTLIMDWLMKQPSGKRRVGIFVSDKIGTPLAAGLFNPKVILPKAMDMRDQTLVEHVLTHELIHIRRLDQLWKFLLIMGLCIHWFNPLVWVMCILANRDLELSCDEKAIKNLGEETKQAYAMSLICMVETKSRLAPLYNGFGKSAAKERISSIMKFKNTTITGIALAAIICCGALTAFAGSKAKALTGSDAVASSIAASQEEVAEIKKIYDEYASFGLIYDEQKELLFFKGKAVGFFVDNRSDDPENSFAGTVFDVEEDAELRFAAERDDNQKLIGIKEISKSEAQQYRRFWGN